MKCENCGAEFNEGIFCPECGTKIQQDKANEYQSNTVYYAKAKMSQKKNTMAIVSLIMGIVSIVTFGCWIIPEIVAIVCGIVSKKNGKSKAATAGIVCGIISSIIFILIIGYAISVNISSDTDNKTTTEAIVKTEEAVEAIATTEETTTEETNKENIIDISAYYGKNISEFEKDTGITLNEDGNGIYYSDNFSFVMDESGNIIDLAMTFNPTLDDTFTFEGITMQDSMEEAANKLKENGYDYDEDAMIYKNEDGIIISLIMSNEDEYILEYMTYGIYMQQYGDYETSEITGYYPGDTAYGDTIKTYVEYAYTEDSWGSNMVRVECEITNISDESITFNPRDYYQLDNNGVTINVNGTDYDYKEISSGYSFKATLSFTCPEGSNKDLSLMTMTADNLEFNLGSKPQSSEEMQGLAGEYSRFNGKSRIIISDNGDGTYDVQTFNTIGDETYIDKYTNITLDENNIFYVNGDAGYLWEPDEYTLYSYDGTWDKINENQTPWVKE